ncbi:MAG: hypothetical protein GQ557_01690 [Mycoplasmataceae bacterium]|nr:hypothetical protein [Mycoplasmataceae bacterium]
MSPTTIVTVTLLFLIILSFFIFFIIEKYKKFISKEEYLRAEKMIKHSEENIKKRIINNLEQEIINTLKIVDAFIPGYTKLNANEIRTATEEKLQKIINSFEYQNLILTNEAEQQQFSNLELFATIGPFSWRKKLSVTLDQIIKTQGEK